MLELYIGGEKWEELYLSLTDLRCQSVNGMSAEVAQRTLRRAFSQEEELCSAVRRI